MAIGYSEAYVAEQYRSPRLWYMRVVNRLFPIVEAVRKSERKILPGPRLDSAHVPCCEITSSLEQSAEHFRRHRWAFVENVFNPDFHVFLTAHWPQRRYFTAPFDLHKAYDKGFRWVERDPDTENRWGSLIAKDGIGGDYPAYIERHPQVRVLFDYMRSRAFIDRVINFTGCPAQLQFNRFQLTWSYPGTLVAPHKDSPQNAASWVHFIFYISGTGGENSGGTAILGDNEFKQVIFEPTKMINTCMIFDPSAPFFHGVRPLAFGKYRWMVSAEYVSSKSAGVAQSALIG